MQSKREATAEELRTLTGDLRNLVTTVTTDPKAQARKERRWRLLYGGLSAVGALVARRFAGKAWFVLTGEHPPSTRPTKR